MAKIRVDPAILTSNSSTISSTASSVSTAGKLAQSAAFTAPSYNGQFGLRVKAIGAEAMARATSLNCKLNNSGIDLIRRAQLFDSADKSTIAAMNGNLTNISKLVGNSFPYYSIPNTQINNSSISYFETNKFTLFPGKLDLKLELPYRSNIWQSGPGRPPEPKTAIDLKIPVLEYTAFSNKKTGDSIILGGIRTGGKAGYDALQAEAGIGIGFHGGKPYAGAYAEGTLLKGSASQIIGTTDSGIGVGVEGKLLSAEASLGLKGETLSAVAGVVIASVEGELGGNINGTSIGVIGGIGLKFEVGVKFGPKNTRLYLGPFTIGLKIGEALGS